jgi:hypothetical protein
MPAKAAAAIAGIVHVRCGDDILERLRVSGLPGTPLRWIDPLCEGPTPGGLDEAGFRRVRADWLADRYRLDRGSVLETLTAQDRALDDAAVRGDEMVLWVDHGLFDQVILVRLIDRLWPRAAGRLSLIGIDRHAAVGRFLGLGQLTAAQLAALFPGRRRVTAAQAALAIRTWQAFTADTPEPLEAVATGEGRAALPFLGAALDRHRRQYPWRRHGLALTGWRTLEAVAGGATTVQAVFAFLQARERTPWQGAAMVEAGLRDLAAGPVPLLVIDGDGTTAALALTGAGRAVLEGRRDGLAGRLRERWLGGVHLNASAPDWRWDDVARQVVAGEP